MMAIPQAGNSCYTVSQLRVGALDMSTIKESLQDMIDRLNDEEARQILEFAQHLREKGSASPTAKCLAGDPAFEIPSEETGVFHVVQPIQGKGMLASELLVAERR